MIKKINLIFVTFFGTGYIKVASGTFASLLTSIILFYLFRSFITIKIGQILCLLFLFIFIYSLFAISNLKDHFVEVDAKQIVIDEVVGQAIPILVYEYFTYLKIETFGANLYLYIFSFVVFRFFDIFKPFPISYFDKNYKNSFEIIFDDILAGIYTLIAVLLLIQFF